MQNILSNHKKPGGFHVVHPDLKELKNRIDEGYTLIAYGDDMVFFSEAVKLSSDNLVKLRNGKKKEVSTNCVIMTYSIY